MDTAAVEERRNGSVNNAFGADIITARIVANYGDPGLTEQYMFDILSRFLIVMLTPDGRVPQYNSSPVMFTIVKRPKHLWIDVDGGIKDALSSQRRSDYNGNISKGDPDNLSLDNIPQINRPYDLGETIKCKKLDKTINFEDTFFSSLYDAQTYLNDAAKNKYNENYLKKDPVGSATNSANVSLNSTNYNSVRIYPLYDAAGVRDFKIRGVSYVDGFHETIDTASYPTASNSGDPIYTINRTYDITRQYGIGLNKYTFEVFWRYIAKNLTGTDSVIRGNSLLYNKFKKENGPYMWDANVNPTSIGLFTHCAYEDMNVDAKTRDPVNECLPLVVTNPSQFPVPKTKDVGSIKFNPTFSQIATT
jgi:hypothetical protein